MASPVAEFIPMVIGTPFIVLFSWQHFFVVGQRLQHYVILSLSKDE
jgi:hypothetical protein